MPEISRLPEGFLLDERYRIGNLLSVGGMGAVYEASHTLLQKPVAIKVLRTDLPSSDLMIDRFRREAIAASAIGHENIVQVTDMGITHDGTAYLVMELLHGRNLGDAIRAEAPFTIERSCRIAVDILRGVGAAHEAGIVHRDLKPDNVFLVKRGSREVVKLLDFGVALLKRPDVPDTRLTYTGTVLGTPRYMSPEQARGDHHLTGAADLYSVGVLLYEMLTGKLPYFGTNYNVIIHEIISGDRVPIESRRPDVPQDLATFLSRAMALAPEDRFESTEQMVMVLERFAGELSSPGFEPAALAPTMSASSSVMRAAEGSSARRKPPSDGAPSRPPDATPRRKIPSTPAALLDHEPAWAPSKGAGRIAHPASTPSGQFSHDLNNLPPRAERGGKTIAIALAVVGVAVIAAFMFMGGGDDDDKTAAAADAAPSTAVIDSRGEGAAAKAEPAPTPVEPEVEVDAAAEKDVEKPAAETKAPPAEETRKPAEETRKPAEETRKPAETKKPAEETKPKERDSEVTIAFLIVPPSARVTADGKPVSGKRLKVKRGRKSIKLRIEAAGYETKTMAVTPTADRELLIHLDPKAEEPPPRPEPKPEPDPEPSPPPDDDGDEPPPGDGE